MGEAGGDGRGEQGEVGVSEKGGRGVAVPGEWWGLAERGVGGCGRERIKINR